MIEIIILSRKHSVQCFDPNATGRDPGFIGWAELNPEQLFCGRFSAVPRIGELVAIPYSSGSSIRARVKDVEYIASSTPRVQVTLDWYDVNKMRILIKAREKDA
jgi:hypothetical protein